MDKILHPLSKRQFSQQWFPFGCAEEKFDYFSVSEVIKKFKEPFLLLTDGDTSIFDSLKGKMTVLVQRCLWHIPYQAQYVLWSDGVKRKSKEWLHVVAELMEICAIWSLVDCPDTIRAMLESKRARL